MKNYLEIMNALLISIIMCIVASVADNRVEQSIRGVGTEVLRPKKTEYKLYFRHLYLTHHILPGVLIYKV